MRAILLVKDKEGLNTDRLQNSRYGLSGKPTVTQQGVAGSLNSSFKASQQVTISNLRSLTSKLKETQRALDGAKNNINKTDQIQDSMDKDKDELEGMLAGNAWEQLWAGEMSPFLFYSTKFHEDHSNESLAGEEGYPVQSIGNKEYNFLQYAPLPRFPYFDPLLKWRWVNVKNASVGFIGGANSVPEDGVENFLTKGFYDDWKTAEKIQSMGQSFRDILTYLEILDGIVAVLRIMLTAKRPSTAKSTIIHTAIDALIIVLATVTIKLIEKTVNAQIYSFCGYNVANAEATELCFVRKTNQITVFANFYDKIQTIIRNTLNIINAIYMGTYAALLALMITGTIMSYVIFPPFIAIAGEGIITGVMVAYQVASAAYYPAIVVPIIQSIQQIIDLSSSRYLEARDGSSIRSESSTELGEIADYAPVLEYNGSTLENFVSEVIFSLSKVKYWLNILIPGIAIPSFHKYELRGIPNIYKCTGDNYGFYIGYGNADEIGVELSSYFTTSGQYEPTTIPLQSWWPVPKTQFNINDTVSGVINGELYDPLNPTLLYYPEGYNRGNNWRCKYKSWVYDGDYFGRKHGINLVTGTPIYKTVFVVTKWNHSVNTEYNSTHYMFYSCAALVATSSAPNAPLQLLWERSAMYNPYSNVTHAEQMIYNYNIEALPSGLITNNRNGALQYAYFDVKNTGEKSNETYRIIYRNVKNQKTNYLNGQAINTEYEFGPLTQLTGNPIIPGGWGDLESYRWNR